MPKTRLTMCGLAFAVLAAFALVLAGCSRREAAEPTTGPIGRPTARPTTEKIRQTGSTTVLPLAEKWRAAYNAEKPDVDISVSGGGSGVGIKDLIAGTVEIANSSRAIKDEEVQQAKEAGVEPVEHIIAYDGIAVIVHPDNPLAKLSVQQVSDMYVGKMKDWKEVGAQGIGAIQLINRDSASGTYESFKELVVTLHGKDKSRDYAPGTLNQTSNQAVLSMVAQTRAGIGYVGLGYVDESVKALDMIPLEGGEAVSPTSENVLNGSYPISRMLYCYTNGEPAGALKEYLDWVKGADGQAIVEELGFVPVPASG